MNAFSRRQMLLSAAALSALNLSPLSRIAARTTPHTRRLNSISDIQLALRAGRSTAEAITADCLRGIQAHDHLLRSVAWLNPKALEDARKLDHDRSLGRQLGPLHGVPVFAKATYDVAGAATDGANKEWVILLPELATTDSVEVARLRAAGAVILGKTNADDFACGGDGTSTQYGQVRNPYDASETLTPGGSSAGSAVAIACGFAYGALGTDDGGSNRIPAQFESVVGLKTTFGLVPREGVIPTLPLIDSHGPLTGCVEDAALMLQVLAGPDSADRATEQAVGKVPAAYLAHGASRMLRGIKLGVVAEHLYPKFMDPETSVLFERATRDLRETGATVFITHPPVTMANVRELILEDSAVRPIDTGPFGGTLTANALLQYLARRGVRDWNRIVQIVAAYRKTCGQVPVTRPELEAARGVDWFDSSIAQAFLSQRSKIVARLTDYMNAEELDALIFPTVPFPPYSLKTASWPPRAFRPALPLADLLGLPELSVPAGFTPGGLPGANVSFLGRPFDEERLFRIGYAYQQAARVRRPQPPLLTSDR
jgi:Asp-tRNA(Asn)/Glu-tRNA(Gln) amidotransferase A subunit family amidase